MKNILFIILFVWRMSSCNDFLEEQSQTEIRPSTVQDMEKLLEGEAYWTKEDGSVFSDITDIFTDDVTSKVVMDKMLKLKQKDRYKYQWSEMMFEDNGEGSDIRLWRIPYNYIKGANVILDYLDEVEDKLVTDADRREHIRGEAFVLRGFFHFCLVNFFGKPYNDGNPAENLGIPLKLNSGVDTDEYPKRATVSECYKQIETDLIKGTELMSIYRISASTKENRLDYLVGFALLSRMYLYMEDWDKTIQYADSVLNKNPNLLMFSENTGKNIYTGQSGNCENLWQMPANMSNYSSSGDTRMQIYPYSTSDDLINVYGEDLEPGERDFRIMGYDEDNESWPGYYGPAICYLKTGGEKHYDETGNNIIEIVEYLTLNKATIWTGIRNAEVYLNRAEAYIQKYIREGNVSYAQLALDDLNNLRHHRMNPDGFVVKQISDFADGQKLLEFCWRERRRELCGEGNHRWCDLRRQGMPEVRHVYLDNDTGMKTEYVLKQGDSRYTLPIPREVLDRNPGLEQNKY